jgi:hypothetical protein
MYKFFFVFFCNDKEADRSTRKIVLRQHQNGRARRRDSRKLPTAIFTLLCSPAEIWIPKNPDLKKKIQISKPKSRSQNRPSTPHNVGLNPNPKKVPERGSLSRPTPKTHTLSLFLVSVFAIAWCDLCCMLSIRSRV